MALKQNIYKNLQHLLQASYKIWYFGGFSIFL